MSKIRIITDSASDISPADEKLYHIDIMPFQVVLGDQSFTSRQDFDNEGFYKLLAQYNEIPKTSQITAFTFEEKFKECYEAGDTDVFYISINSHGSATYQNSVMAVDNFYEEYPEAQGKMNIRCYDGISYTGAYGEVAVCAARMAEEGAAPEEVNAYIEKILPRRRIYFGIYELFYAGKSGRIPSAAAFLGDKLGIKPVMKIADHEITTAGKCRGEKKVIAKIIELVKAEMEEGSEYQIVYGNDSQVRDDLEKRFTKEIGYGPTKYYQIGSEVAANAGPKVVGILFNTKEGV